MDERPFPHGPLPQAPPSRRGFVLAGGLAVVSAGAGVWWGRHEDEPAEGTPSGRHPGVDRGGRRRAGAARAGRGPVQPLPGDAGGHPGRDPPRPRRALRRDPSRDRRRDVPASAAGAAARDLRRPQAETGGSARARAAGGRCGGRARPAADRPAGGTARQHRRVRSGARRGAAVTPRPDPRVLAAWQDALAAEQQAAWGYPLLGPHLPADRQDRARACQAVHEQVRNDTADAIAAAGATPRAPQGDYPALYGLRPARAGRPARGRLRGRLALPVRGQLSPRAPRVTNAGCDARGTVEAAQTPRSPAVRCGPPAGGCVAGTAAHPVVAFPGTSRYRTPVIRPAGYGSRAAPRSRRRHAADASSTASSTSWHRSIRRRRYIGDRVNGCVPRNARAKRSAERADVHRNASSGTPRLERT